MEKIKIETEEIKLDQFLKWINVGFSGGQAKEIIREGLVKVNGVVVTQRGKKLRENDLVEIEKIGVFQVVR
jgi:ribosome-associated protein